MSQVYAVYWSDPKAQNESGKKYRVQVHIPPEFKLSEVRIQFDDWELYGESTTPGERIYLYSRIFEKDSQFNSWKKSCNFHIGQTPPGEKKKIGTGRKCGICGEYGHNARTCSINPENENKILESKKERNKQYKCGKCGELGHNARTCPMR